tara:strand:+ start:25 stop:291 length:267 start_codon:yes stop_codon:yes gene_type:complete
MEIRMANELNKIEKQVLTQVNLNEGLLTKIVRRLYKRTMDRTLKGLINQFEDDPELKAAMSDLQKSRERSKDVFKSYCKKHPESNFCK